MFGKKKNEADSAVENDDIFYLLSLIAEKVGVDLNGEEPEETEEVETEETEEINNSCKEQVVENEESTDKRRLIDEIGGILKGKVDEELWRTVIGKAEKLAYTGSEDNKLDNEIKEEKEETREEIAEEQRKTGVDELEKKENSIKKPVLEIKKSLVNNSISNVYKTRDERIKETNKKFYL